MGSATGSSRKSASGARFSPPSARLSYPWICCRSLFVAARKKYPTIRRTCFIASFKQHAVDEITKCGY
ncbi:Protoheme IX farnesyltransferase mitochondrial [Zea mays]|uniref:Protoheme IX farnesyltransferase mitochondrial n=1 Tax=Zea mays TaxID=4577 RepID=A0A1D6JQ30_MAIZE|nr:Protoheme IX farnesyltransferase mitochondrial [Zea mays]